MMDGEIVSQISTRLARQFRPDPADDASEPAHDDSVDAVALGHDDVGNNPSLESWQKVLAELRKR